MDQPTEPPVTGWTQGYKGRALASPSQSQKNARTTPQTYYTPPGEELGLGEEAFEKLPLGKLALITRVAGPPQPTCFSLYSD